jgi:hypothetical protein
MTNIISDPHTLLLFPALDSDIFFLTNADPDPGADQMRIPILELIEK